jgi:hypothetical protein
MQIKIHHEEANGDFSDILIDINPQEYDGLEEDDFINKLGEQLQNIIDEESSSIGGTLEFDFGYEQAKEIIKNGGTLNTFISF